MFLENKELDKTVPIPLYFQLKKLIVDEIKSRKYEVDSLIPTEKELSDQFDISRTTVRQAITELVQEGWLPSEITGRLLSFDFRDIHVRSRRLHFPSFAQFLFDPLLQTGQTFSCPHSY